MKEEINMKVDNYDAILAFSFGRYSHEKKMGTASNRLIAMKTCKLSKDHNCPIVAQEDLMGYLRKDICVDAHYLKGKLSTLQIIENIKSYLPDLKKVLVVAAPMMMKRCIRDLKKMDFKPEAYDIAYGSKFFYNKNSLQKYTRNWFNWWTRELIIRLLPWFIYKRLCGNSLENY